MAVSNIVLIAAVEAERAAKAALESGAGLEDRARAAMGAVRGHWLATQELDQFSAACEGLARTSSPEEVERIEGDLKALQTLSAMMSGVPVDLDAALADHERHEPLGLMKLWRETANV